jgi:hypothetical protein
MRCRTCGSKAVINMPQHRLALCKAHYLEWLPAQTQRDIAKYKMFDKSDHILVAVSGGKDSLARIFASGWYQTEVCISTSGIDGGTTYYALPGNLQ